MLYLDDLGNHGSSPDDRPTTEEKGALIISPENTATTSNVAEVVRLRFSRLIQKFHDFCYCQRVPDL